MKRLGYIIAVVLFTSSLVSCGVTKNHKLDKGDEITLSLKEKKEIVKQQIVNKQRTMIATP
ncbi:hypothetical protein [Planktosalinus lacus]|uniref:Lipoprotein n=1 Tax=Planktosalinus lacus TaxID=1526573 RepID=A0A8J2VDD3_9FLAO|nr:hypothetical protein [Planktosalinus lacus]GGE01645.1 hypothetical protein GCM10011312_26350 [Planktosalinus lacus]